MTAFPAPTETPLPAPESQPGRDIALAMQTAIEHHRNEQYDDAAALYTAVLDEVADHLDAHYHLGVLRMQTGQPAAAVSHFEAALGQVPANGQIWVYYVNALIESNQVEAARVALDLAHRQYGLPAYAFDTLSARINQPDAAASATPDATQVPAAQPSPPASTSDTHAQVARDTTATPKLDTRRPSAGDLRKFAELFGSGKNEAALELARRLTQQYPAVGQCWFMLVDTLRRTGRYPESVPAAEQAARLLPDNLSAQTALADGLYITRQYQRLEAHCRDKLEKFPDSAALHRSLGAALQETGRHAEGIVHHRRAVELAPDSALEFDALGFALGRHGLHDEADAAYRRALELAPMQAATRSNMLFNLMHKTDLDATSAFTEFREFAVHHEAGLRAKPPRHTNDRDPARRLKIGFVSGDLVNHPVAYFFLSALEYLARDPSLSVHVYSNYVVSDGFTEQIRAHVHEWHEIFGMTDAAVVQKIRDDGIDILIDLSGHTGRNRLVVFAQKPAPVQVSWIGNPSTTGLTAIDYYMSDRFVTPLEQFAGVFSEKLVFLPALAPFKPHPQAPDVNALPALKNGFLTFGSFSRIVKIGPAVVALWARVLREIPNSRMLIGAISAPEQISKLTGLFANEGINVNRIGFLQRKNVTTYLQQHHLIDVCLDAFPFAGSTTTLQAIWMGVPTVTLPGTSMASRSSTGWLSHLGLDEAFVASDKDDFVRKCVALAADFDALAAVRRELRQHCMSSPLISASTIANAASRALRIMWQRWCDKLEPEHFEVLAEPADTPAVEDPPDSAREQRATLIREFTDTLTVLLDKQQFAEAEGIARQFTTLLPDVGNGWRLLATSLQRQGKSREALEPLQQAQRLLPHDTDIHKELSRLSQYVNDLKRIAPINQVRSAADLAALRPGTRQYRHPVGALMANVPVLIPTFNNATYARRMVEQLHSRGLRNVMIVDNASSATSMIDYLDSIEDSVSVVRLDHNVGPRAITLSDVIYHRLPDIFCLTDPDLDFHPELPDTFLFDLVEATEKMKIGKAGFALDISQPELMDEKALSITQSDGAKKYNLIEWETRFWQQQIGHTSKGDPIYRAPIDTTFAVYNKRYFRRETHLSAVRFGGSYTCRHLPWYKDNGLDATEAQYYRDHQEWSTFLR